MVDLSLRDNEAGHKTDCAVAASQEQDPSLATQTDDFGGKVFGGEWQAQDQPAATHCAADQGGKHRREPLEAMSQTTSNAVHVVHQARIDEATEHVMSNGRL